MATVICRGVAEVIASSSSSSPFTANILSLNSNSLRYYLPSSNSTASIIVSCPPPHSLHPLQKTGVCRASSQVSELFPSISSPDEIVVREARLEDSWGIAETHCSSFFPNFSFPLNLMLRMNRTIRMMLGYSVPKSCKKTCLVAGFDGNVIGILTLDTVADFLPRKGPLLQRRTWIAYISNVAVQEKHRGKGIAKKLVAKAESEARTWGCRAIALHCDADNLGAIKLYIGSGFRSIKVPEGANWPRPRASPRVHFIFMMKLLEA